MSARIGLPGDSRLRVQAYKCPDNLIREILRGFGFLRITEALSVEDALERVQIGRPDIIRAVPA